MAQVEFGELVKEISIQWVEDLKVGDYILVHAGMALNKIDEENARLTLQALNELEDQNRTSTH